MNSVRMKAEVVQVIRTETVEGTGTKARLRFIKKYMIGTLMCIVLDTGLKVRGRTGFIVKNVWIR